MEWTFYTATAALQFVTILMLMGASWHLRHASRSLLDANKRMIANMDTLADIAKRLQQEAAILGMNTETPERPH